VFGELGLGAAKSKNNGSTKTASIIFDIILDPLVAVSLAKV
jgi:hypothetical protein